MPKKRKNYANDLINKKRTYALHVGSIVIKNSIVQLLRTFCTVLCLILFNFKQIFRMD